jgi:hypothetical protein
VTAKICPVRPFVAHDVRPREVPPIARAIDIHVI